MKWTSWIFGRVLASSHYLVVDRLCPGEMRRWWMGFCWHDILHREIVVATIPLCYVLRFGRIVLHWLWCPWPSCQSWIDRREEELVRKHNEWSQRQLAQSRIDGDGLWKIIARVERERDAAVALAARLSAMAGAESDA